MGEWDDPDDTDPEEYSEWPMWVRHSCGYLLLVDEVEQYGRPNRCFHSGLEVIAGLEPAEAWRCPGCEEDLHEGARFTPVREVEIARLKAALGGRG